MSLLNRYFACFLTWFVASNFLFGCSTTAHRYGAHFWLVQSIFCQSRAFFLSFRTPVRNPLWMLRFAQHDRAGVIPSASEESSCGCFTALSMTGLVAFRAHARNPVQCGCFTALSMTGLVSFRAKARNPLWMPHYATLR